MDEANIKRLSLLKDDNINLPTTIIEAIEAVNLIIYNTAEQFISESLKDDVSYNKLLRIISECTSDISRITSEINVDNRNLTCTLVILSGIINYTQSIINSSSGSHNNENKDAFISGIIDIFMNVKHTLTDGILIANQS